MRKGLIFIGLVIVIISLLLFTGCKPKVEDQPQTLFNESLNQEIEDLTQVEGSELVFNQRPEAKYEITQDDIFMDSKGNFTSLEISFFGVMLGDSFNEVEEILGPADTTRIPADESYKNMHYKKTLGISGDKEPGLNIHLVNDIVTRITVTPSAGDYLQGNTSIGTEKELIYTILDVPEYQDFVATFRVFHYVEKGLEVYLDANKLDRISFIFPQEFNGVEYVTTPTISEVGLIVNITKPVLVD